MYTNDVVIDDVTNNKVPGKFKDETGGREIQEFVGLRSKMYSFTVSDAEVNKSAGIASSVIKSSITHKNYVDCISGCAAPHVANTSIRSFSHDVYTTETQQTGLSPFDDKRYVLDCGVDTLAYGHCDISQSNTTF